MEIDGRLRTPNGSRPTTLLALLAVHANRRVPVDTMIEALWGDQVTDGRASTLESHVWRLRRVLEPGRGRGTAPTVLVNDTGGYRLLVDPADIDSAVFERLADEGRVALATGRPDRALQRFDAAIELWRGPPFTPCGDQPWAEAYVARLEELYAQVRERRVDALLALGRTDQALLDLQPLIHEAPYREHLHCQRMLALARHGRIEEALNAYRVARDSLVDELGVEPGAELRDLQQRILDGDPTLLPTASATPAVATPGVATLAVAAQPVAATATPSEAVPVVAHAESRPPRRGTPIIGRATELHQLAELIGESHLLSIVGAAGCGKTRLAIELTHVFAPRFPDGVWFVDLGQVDHPALVVDLTLATLGVAVPAVGTPLRALASQISGRQALVVLDNCEHVLPGVGELVQTIVDEDADCTVVATSREPLGLPGELIYTLAPLRLPDAERPQDASPAVEMFRSRFRLAEPTVTLTEGDLRRVAQICIGLDGLPLAIELAAARGRSYSIAEIAEQVTLDPTGLARQGAAAPGHGTLRDEIDRSYRQMTDAEQGLHRALAVLPGPFTAAVAAAVADESVGGRTIDLIPMLVNHSMLTSTRSNREGWASTFRQLETVRAHARQLLTEAGERDAMLDRRDRWVRSVLGAGFRLGRGEIMKYRTLEANYAAVRATLERELAGQDEPATPLLAAQLTMFWYTREQIVEARRWLDLAVRRARDAPAADQAAAHAALAWTLTFQGRADLARPHTDAVAALLDQVPIPRRAFVGDLLAVIAAAAMTTDEFDYMRTVFDAATAVAADVADPDLDVLCAAVRGLVDISSGADPRQCAATAAAAHRRAVDARHIFAAFLSASAGAYAELALGNPERGLEWSDRALDLSLTYGSLHGAGVVETRANLLAECGRPAEAARMYGAASAQALRLGGRWPRRALTARLLREVQATLAPADFEKAYQAGERLTLVDLGAVVTPE
jgi:predicted ATPase/DNA-binding SARP family transcriptional activator